MSLYNLFFWGVPTVALVSYLLLLFFFSISKKDRVVTAFQSLLITLAFWTMCSLLMKLSVYPGVLFWNRMMVAFTFATPLAIYIFLSIFTNTVRFGKIAFWSGMTLAGIVVNLIGLMVKEASMVNLDPGPGGFFAGHMVLNYVTGPAGAPVLAFQAIFIIAIILKARHCVIKNVSSYERVKPIMVGMVILFIGVCCNALPIVGKYPIDILASFINSIMIMVALYKNKMIEMKIVFTRGIVYSIFVGAIVFGYVYSVFSLERNIRVHFGEVSQYFVIFSALIVAFIFQPILRLAHMLSNKLFYKTEYNQRSALMDFSLNMSHNLNLNEISHQLIDTVEKAMNVQRSSLVLKDDLTGDYSTYKSTISLNHLDVKIVKDSPIVKWLSEKGGCISKNDLDFYPQFKGVWDSEKRALEAANIEVLVAVKCREQLIGIILLAGKRNNVPYSSEDLDLLASFGASTALAVENARLYTRAQIEAVTDNLTGLFNHRYLFKYLSDNMSSEKKDNTISVLNMDLDMFKLYNDLFGHSEGNNALKKVATIISDAVDRRGIAVRFSGGNFIVVLPGHDSHQAHVIAEKIRLDVQKAFFSDVNVTNRFLTMSIGICTYPFAAVGQEQLLKRADFALYTAKQNGKNQTFVYTSTTDTDKKPIQEGAVTGDDLGMMTSKPAYAATLYALTAAIDAKDQYTFSHSQKVAQYASVLAAELGMDKFHVDIIHEAGLLHDIGKIGIGEHILAKKGRLTAEEYAIMKQHVEMSITIIKHLPSVNHVIPAIIGHHERWDGTGYPRGLKGVEIPLEARCLAVADSFDAITSLRPYKSPRSVEFALAEIERNSGAQFDPDVAEVFVRLVRTGVINVVEDPVLALMN